MKRVEQAADALLTLSEIRRRYFAPGSAPTKTVLKRWIRDGAGGVFLPAKLIDGRFYVAADDFRRFLDATTAPTKRPARRFSRSVDSALAACVKLGVRLD